MYYLHEYISSTYLYMIVVCNNLNVGSEFWSYLMTWIVYNQYKLFLHFLFTEEEADKLSLGGPIGGAVGGVVILLIVISVVVFIARKRYWFSFINLCTVKPALVTTTIKQ
jgi:hypothetical protein